MVKRGLGRGLEALIPQEIEPSLEQVISLEVDSIDPNPRQPRQKLDEAGLQELADSIREHGVVQPVVVSRTATGRYQLVAGERRWRACILLGIATVPAIIKDFDERQSTEVALVENLQREDLNALEEAMAYRNLQDEFGLTQEEVAMRVGKSRAQVANTLRLLQLPGEIKEMLHTGVLSAGHGRVLLALSSQADQLRVAREIAKKGLSVRETEELVKLILLPARPVRVRRSQSNPEWDMVARGLAEKLGTKVRIKASGGRGRIEVDFYSLEELSRLLDVFGVDV